MSKDTGCGLIPIGNGVHRIELEPPFGSVLRVFQKELGILLFPWENRPVGGFDQRAFLLVEANRS
jgi:hypothetical protein